MPEGSAGTAKRMIDKASAAAGASIAAPPRPRGLVNQAFTETPTNSADAAQRRNY